MGLTPDTLIAGVAAHRSLGIEAFERERNERVRPEGDVPFPRVVRQAAHGAARNAAPMASEGATLIGTDTAWAMFEAARVARPGASLFVFTFSRATFDVDARPVPGEPFVFTRFAGEPQCSLTEAELKAELLRCGFEKDPPGPLAEYDRPIAGCTLSRGGPVISEGTFRAVRQS
ncbi:MAG: hypothetical protein U0529_15620 [Thermoanaerobaculia bacterium]